MTTAQVIATAMVISVTPFVLYGWVRAMRYAWSQGGTETCTGNPVGQPKCKVIRTADITQDWHETGSGEVEIRKGTWLLIEQPDKKRFWWRLGSGEYGPTLGEEYALHDLEPKV